MNVTFCDISERICYYSSWVGVRGFKLLKLWKRNSMFVEYLEYNIITHVSHNGCLEMDRPGQKRSWDDQVPYSAFAMVSQWSTSCQNDKFLTGLVVYYSSTNKFTIVKSLIDHWRTTGRSLWHHCNSRIGALDVNSERWFEVVRVNSS